MRQAFLDMDGVLADFVSAICIAHNRPSPYTDPSSYGIFDMEKLWGITSKEFWCSAADTFEFWDEMSKTPEADDLVAYLTRVFGVENICVLTAPSNSPFCVPGKRAWIRRYFPQFKDRIIFANSKEFLGGMDKFLIDDRDKNIDAFERAGGNAVIMPRLWNREWRRADVSIHAVKDQIEEILHAGVY